MLLPKDLLAGTYTKPKLFLCETDKTRICELHTTEMNGSFKFNSYSELEFTVGRTYEDFMSGQTRVNPFYDKIEALRLVELDGFGFFEIQDPEIVSNGIMECKNVSANSSEYSLSQKYLEEFYVNTGETRSLEFVNAEDEKNIVPITLYNPAKPKLSLLHLALEKVYGWKIGHVDDSLKTMSRTFEISRASVYDFIMQDLCDKFNCFVVFDTINNTINFYAETLITKFIGDGSKKSFIISPAYDTIGSVSIDSYKTIDYTYSASTGVLTLGNAPAQGALVEVTDGSQAKWITDVYVTFENLAQEVNISYSADDIKTVLTVKGADDIDIREVNMGMPYIVDLSYYYSVDWMGQELYDAYTAYLRECDGISAAYKENSQKMLELNNYIWYERNRLSLQYAIASHVNAETVGEYYVRGGTSPNYYYKKVLLPTEYSSEVAHYYSLSGTDLNEVKMSNLYSAIQAYYVYGTVTDFNDIEDDFAFMRTYTISYLRNELSKATTTAERDTVVSNFLDEMWEQVGLTPLKDLYYAQYTQIKDTNIKDGWSVALHKNYWRYYPVLVVISSIERAMNIRKAAIAKYEEQYEEIQLQNDATVRLVSMEAFFEQYFKDQGLSAASAKVHAQQLLIRLNPFLREDEYTDDNFIITDADTIESSLRIKQELLECGRIELSKLCAPKLGFSMDMANIYALPEFAPIVHQFQLGYLINVVLRSDYIKRARLLEVNINFHDFADFSCEFGELTNLKTPSSIHADLLANALTAGKSVASNASYWNKGADLATSTDLKLQQGLLDATEGLYSSIQGVVIDKNGIWLTKLLNEQTGEVSPYQARLVNNNILFSSDGFKTSEVGLGEFTIDGETFYGLLAQAVISGYIEGSNIVGGTINIGNGTFMVDEFGNVTMGGASKIGDMTVQDLKNYMEDDNNIVYTACPIDGNYLSSEIWVVGHNDYIQTDENGNRVDDSGNIIAPASMGEISENKTHVLSSDGNIIGTIKNNLVLDVNNNVIGVYNAARNIASNIIGLLNDGIAVDFNGDRMGLITKKIVANDSEPVGLIVDHYVIAIEIVGTTDVNIVEAGSILRSVNDGRGIYTSSDWVSALSKYDSQHESLNNRLGSIEIDLDQHFEFSNDNGMVIKDGNSAIYTRLLNDRWSFMQQDNDPLVGDAEVAYISDKKLYISSAEITGLDAEDGNLDVNGPATVKKLRVENNKADNSLVIQAETNGSFSILIQTKGVD